MVRILVADDDPGVRSALRKHLERAGFSVVEAQDGVEALMLLSDDVSVALVDQNMPGHHGVELLRRIRAVRPQIRLVAMSGVEEALDAVAAALAPIYVLPKPFTFEQLQAILRAP